MTEKSIVKSKNLTIHLHDGTTYMYSFPMYIEVSYMDISLEMDW